jgi:hypothetical protein
MEISIIIIIIIIIIKYTLKYKVQRELVEALDQYFLRLLPCRGAHGCMG